MLLKKQKLALALGISLSISFHVGSAPAQTSIAYNHDRYNTQPGDIIKTFQAYTVSFDSGDDNDGDEFGEVWRIPEWVAYEVRKYKGRCVPVNRDNTSWFSDEDLADEGIAPRYDSYTYAADWWQTRPNWYKPGQLTAEFIAQRLGREAAKETYSVMNVVPQRNEFDRGIWRALEFLTAAWAQRYGAVWVISGPVIFDRQPSGWIGDDGEMAVAIPDALFKIVARESKDPNRPHILAFLYPQYGPFYFDKAPYPHQHFLVSVDKIEALTGLDFFTNLPTEAQKEIESEKKEWLWSVKTRDYVRICS